jgi:adenine-specific DNA-methyltransferase
MAAEKIRPTFTFTEDRLAELRAVVPEAFEDSVLNWELLREALGDYADGEPGPEHFGLNWPGKREARRLAAKPSHGTLVPARGEGINEDSTGNIFIEGDNLEVLKLLQKSYAGRIKMIYIDPPYNTGNDFIYKDDYSEPLESYLRRTGQTGERGELLTSNPKSSGRFHSNWLNMMYPRLRLAKTLLSDQGVIFISIDDNEIHNLRSIMDEVFGAENFLANVVWQKKYAPSNDTVDFSYTHDYIMAYARQRPYTETGRQARTLGRVERTEEQNKLYKNPDNDPRGLWRTDNYLCNKTAEQRPNLYYPIVQPKTGREIWPSRSAVWRYSRERHAKNVTEGRVWWGQNGDNSVPAFKRFLSDVGGIVSDTWWTHTSSGHNDEAKKQLKELMPEATLVFSTPKPARLISRLIQLASPTDEDNPSEDLILDFFAGSATTAHAVLQLNRQDGGNRRFILVQIAEATPDPKFHTIAEISKERIRRVIAKLKTAAQQQLRDKNNPEDLGFKVLKLTASNFQAWRDYEGDDLNTIHSLFDQQETPLVDGWTRENLLTEILLIEGFPLDSKAEPQPQFAANAVTRVTSPACGHALWTCFDETVRPATVNADNLPEGDIFICLDSALDDNAKLRLTQAGILKTI